MVHLPASLILLILSISFCNAQRADSLPLPIISKNSVITFEWKGDSVGGRWEPNAYMLIPVQLDHSPTTYFMQFDLGAPYSLLYKNNLAAMQSQPAGSLKDVKWENRLLNFAVTSGASRIQWPEIPVEDFGSSEQNNFDTSKLEIIGTIGADLIDGRVAVIDYPSRLLTITDDVAGNIPTVLGFTKFIYSNKRILFPAKIMDKETLLFFDTGSSMFELLASKETCEQLALPGSKQNQYKVNSWGRSLVANTVPASGIITMAGVQLPVSYVTYMDGVGKAQVEQMAHLGIGGMVGNKLFLKQMLVLDCKRQQFALIKKP